MDPMNAVSNVVSNITPSELEAYLMIVKYISAAVLIGTGASITAITQAKVASKTIEAIANNYNAEKTLRSTLWTVLIMLEMSTLWCLVVVFILLFR